MGWSSGSTIAIGVIKLAKSAVPEGMKPKFYRGLIELLQDEDWDCEHDAEGIDPAFDRVLKKTMKEQGF